MRPRTELALGTALVLALAIIAGMLGQSRERLTDADSRRSTVLAGPAGARGFAQALARRGVRVESHRRPVTTLDSAAVTSRTLTAFLNPSRALDARESRDVAALPRDLLLAGAGAAGAMRCLGWDLRPRARDSLGIAPPADAEPRAFPRVRAVLQVRTTAEAVDSSEEEDGAAVRCTAPAARSVDTVLSTLTRRLIVVRLSLADSRTMTLVADDGLFGNRALRETAAGPFALGLVTPRYDHVVFDEYHHGFDASRSLAGATLDWTLRTPWGWAILQLAAVGILALLVAGVRFGPIRDGLVRRRRSPLEHVRALATALAAARGHDEAVALIVQGLRRRLSREGHAPRGELGPWLASLAPALRTARGRTALDALAAISRRPASAEDVLSATDAVDTLWEELTPT